MYHRARRRCQQKNGRGGWNRTSLFMLPRHVGCHCPTPRKWSARRESNPRHVLPKHELDLPATHRNLVSGPGVEPDSLAFQTSTLTASVSTDKTLRLDLHIARHRVSGQAAPVELRRAEPDAAAEALDPRPHVWIASTSRRVPRDLPDPAASRARPAPLTPPLPAISASRCDIASSSWLGGPRGLRSRRLLDASQVLS